MSAYFMAIQMCTVERVLASSSGHTVADFKNPKYVNVMILEGFDELKPAKIIE